ncbi:uncharacterized protein LY89DRAFT_275941 [Mollisia scopiformis]|uniref:Uncharacterized protein n=1 Tax=Mollisia scopiformis TaxID=149040 RepID=A0A132BBA2_MOLSC|nr:uncharacterized protein LY89DRAFT_275941 [Mollisia scopiformis]KUJ09702.1 hypothetical protein LY89DRAFT_275941 [Mollisia scopiformis]
MRQGERPILLDNHKEKLETNSNENPGRPTTICPNVEPDVKPGEAPVENAQRPSHTSNIQSELLAALDTQSLSSRDMPALSKVTGFPKGSFRPIQDEPFNDERPQPDLLAQRKLKRMPGRDILRSPESTIAKCLCSSLADRYNLSGSSVNAVQPAQERHSCQCAYRR